MKRVLLIVLLIPMLAACGSDNPKASAQGDDVKTPATTGSSSETTAPGGKTATTKPGTTATTKPGTPTSGAAGATASSSTTRAPFPVKMSLGKQCVRRGANGDTQTLDIVTRPKDFVGYSTEYSDGSNELTNPSYKSGSGYGQADDDGKVHLEWKLPDNATTGTATLRTIADGRMQPLLHFKVVSQLETC